MNVNRRKWNSMDQLEDVVFDFKAGLAPGASNLRSLKHLSVSTPGMSIQDVNSDNWKPPESLAEFPVNGKDEVTKVDEKESVPIAQEVVPVTNKARQKKFDRQFSINETVLEYYSCALALDILLHGILYVTHNNFAFYSNVFGRVTKVLIPVSSIEKIQKSKTALIIPNAIHVHTNSEKYVFASFMSRENAYTQMQRVWTSFVSKSCGSKMNIIEQHLGLGKESETSSMKDKRIKDLPGAHSEGLGKNNRKKEATGRKSVMFIEEPHEILFANDENEPVNFVPVDNTQVEVDEYYHSEDEPEPFTVEEERADNGKVPEDSQVLRSAISRRATASKTEIKLLRLCYLLTLLLSLSAINLYIRIDAIVEEDISEPNHVENELLKEQRLYRDSMSSDYLTRVNETLKRISMVHEMLEQLRSKQGSDLIHVIPIARADDALAS